MDFGLGNQPLRHLQLSSRPSEARLRWDAGIELHRAAYDARNYGNKMGMVDTLNFDDRISVDQLLVFSSLQWQITLPFAFNSYRV